MHYVIQSETTGRYLFSEHHGKSVPSLWAWKLSDAKVYEDFASANGVSMMYTKEEHSLVLGVEDDETYLLYEPE